MEYEMAMEILGDRERETGNAWQGRLNSATTVAEVVVLVKEFLATWSAEDLVKLPDGCETGDMNSSDDIAFYAFRLVREQCSDAIQCIELHRMATFFSTASQRVSQILAISKYQKLIRAVDIGEWVGHSFGSHLGQRPATLDVKAQEGAEPVDRVDQLPIRHRQE